MFKCSKVCAIIVGITFLLNIFGIGNYAHASDATTTRGDPLSELQEKIEQTARMLETIRLGISKGAETSRDLQNLDQHYAELSNLNQACLSKLDALYSQISKLVEEGNISSEFLERHNNFAVKHQKEMDVLLHGIYQILNTLPEELTVSQIDSILENIKTVLPDTNTIVTGNKTEPDLSYQRLDIPSEKLKSLETIPIGVSLPAAEDLGVTKDTEVSPEISVLSQELGAEPVKIFGYVRNNFDYQPYFGSVKGSVGTYWEKAGNDMDQSSLLISLFRASGIPARYVAGVVELPVSKIMNWVGVTTPDMAVEVISSNGIPYGTKTSADGTITHVRFFHVWVEAYIPKSSNGKAATVHEWVQMDPSFKQYVYQEGLSLKEISGLDWDTFYNRATEGIIRNEAESYITNLNEPNIVADLNSYADNLVSWLNTNMPGATTADVIGSRKIEVINRTQLNNLSQTFPFKTFLPQYEFSEIPEGWRYRVFFNMYGLNYTTSMPEITGKRVSLGYVPATSYDQWLIDYYGGLFNVPAFLVNMTPQLRIENNVVAQGSAVTLGSRQVVRSGFLRPLSPSWDSNDKVVTTGADYAISLNQQRISLDLVKHRLEHFNGLSDVSERTREALHITGLSYFVQCDLLSDVSAQVSGVVWTRSASEAFVTQDLRVWYLWGAPWRVERGGLGIDVKRNIVNPVSKKGRSQDELSWMLNTGAIGSAAEHAVFEQLYGIESVSTEKVLTLANRQGLKIYHINRSNAQEIVPLLDTFPVVKQNIMEAVDAGLTAVVPEKNIQIGQWYGQGWIIVDENTGSAGYLLAGHIVSGAITEEITSGGATVYTVDTSAGLFMEYLRVAHVIEGFALIVAGGLHVWGSSLVVGSLMLGGVPAILIGGLLFAEGLLIAGVGTYTVYEGFMEYIELH